MSTQRDTAFPPPLVFPPLSGTHKSTVILLHGRGRKAKDFATEILLSPFLQSPDAVPTSHSPTTTTNTIQTALPHTKFLVLRARKQRATKYKRSLVRQWFDDWHLLLDPSASASDTVDAHYDDGLQTAGLGDVVAYLLRDLVAHETLCGGGGARKKKNVVLMGFSQGGAAALLAGLLLLRGEQIAGLVGVCTWVPYLRQIVRVSEGLGPVDDGNNDDDDSFDPFERQTAPESADESGQDQDPLGTALAWLRDEIELPVDDDDDALSPGRPLQTPTHVPVLLCHGLDDTKVVPDKSREACDALSTLGVGPVVRKTYEGVAHATSAAMLADILAFLRSVFDDKSEQD